MQLTETVVKNLTSANNNTTSKPMPQTTRNKDVKKRNTVEAPLRKTTTEGKP